MACLCIASDLFLYFLQSGDAGQQLGVRKVSFCLLSYRGQYSCADRVKEMRRRKTVRNQSYVRNIQFDSLKNQQLKEVEKISDQACLPFCYIVEMISELSAILHRHHRHLFSYADRLLHHYLRTLNH